MPEPFGTAVGLWSRCERYEVRNGLIRPVEGASLEPYDPWEAFRHSRTAHGGVPPYQSLLNLVHGLEFRPRPAPGPPRELSSASKKKLLQWCKTNGVLGILPHQTIMVTLAPTLEPLEGNEAVLLATQLQHASMGDGWATIDRATGGTRLPFVRDQPERRGEAIAREDVPRDWPRPGAIWQPLDGGILQEKRFSESWRHFFPDVPAGAAETHPYPRPLTPEFWRAYAEPVEEFVLAATQLADAIERLGTAKPLNDATDGDRQTLRDGMDKLQSLVRTVTPAVVPTPEGSLRQEWISTSLLGSFAMMALLDLTESRRVVACESCGGLFVTKAYQARYCSSTCRFRVQKRRHRSRQG